MTLNLGVMEGGLPGVTRDPTEQVADGQNGMGEQLPLWRDLHAGKARNSMFEEGTGFVKQRR